MPINRDLIFTIKATCPKKLLEWLNYKDPLTDRLTHATGEAQLELLTQRWTNTDLWSKNLLTIQDDLVFQREILMKSHKIVYWYARSIIPQKCFQLDPLFFERLKNESIRNLIFEDKRVVRVNLFSYPINHQCVEFYWVKKYINTKHNTLWTRISEFSFQEQESFYLIETMFPELGDVP